MNKFSSPAPAAWDPSDPTLPAIQANGRPEPSRPRHALLDYLHLGPGRSLSALFQLYQSQSMPPTDSYDTLRRWSSHFDWPARAQSFDEIADRRAQAEYAARREEILQTGLALDHERIQLLSALLNKLSALSQTDEAFWNVQVKSLRTAPDQFERVEQKRFNGNLINHMRGLLNDIAAETGGRISRPRLPAEPAEPAASTRTMDDYSLDRLSDDEREEYLRLMEKMYIPPSRNISPENCE